MIGFFINCKFEIFFLDYVVASLLRLVSLLELMAAAHLVSQPERVCSQLGEKVGGGGICLSDSVSRRWLASKLHISLVELEAIRRSLLHFAPVLQDRDVVRQSDNSSGVYQSSRQSLIPPFSPFGYVSVAVGRDTPVFITCPPHFRSLQRIHFNAAEMTARLPDLRKESLRFACVDPYAEP